MRVLTAAQDPARPGAARLDMKMNVKLAALIVAVAILPLALSNIIVYGFIEQSVKDVAHEYLELAAISRRDRLASEFQHNHDK